MLRERNFSMKLLSFLFIFLCFLLLQVIPIATTNAHSTPDKVLPRISEIRLFRKLGKIDKVIELSKRLISTGKTEDEDIQDAYNELIAAYIIKGDSTAVISTAETALERFPNIKPAPEHYPPEVEEIYGKIRAEKYSLIEVTTKPDNLEVHLDAKLIGKTPLKSYIPAGRHVLFVGDVDRSKVQNIETAPNKSYTYDFTFKENKIPFLSRAELRFGLIADRSTSWLHFSTDERPVNFLSLGLIEKTGDIINYSGGAYIVVSSGGRFAVQTGVRYTQIGSYVYIYPCHSGCKYEFELRYLSFPINLNCYFLMKPRFCIQAGAQLSSLLSARIKEVPSEPTSPSLDVQRNLTSFNIALLAGLGFEIPLGWQSLYLQAQYYHGLDRLTKSSEMYTPEMKTRELKLSLGFLY